MIFSRYSNFQSVVLIIFMTFFMTLSLVDSIMAQPEKVAIIPFEIHSEKDMDYIKAGIFQMLSSRLSLKERVMVATQENTFQSILKNKDISNPELFVNVGKDTESDYVLTGSITEFAGAFSLDTKILNMDNGVSRTFFTQANAIEQIIPELSTLAAIINKEIFNREPSSVQKTVSMAENTPIQKTIRANPETLLPRELFKKQPRKKPFWKFWSRDKE